MKKKLIQIIGLLLFVYATYSSTITNTVEAKVGIIETIPITPDPVTLLKSEVKSTKHWDEGCNDSTLQFSQEDAERLLKIAWAEAGNQGIYGQLLVMEVVINRVNSEHFKETTIADVISKSGFQTYAAGTYENATPTWETHMALAELEKNRDLNTEIIAFETSNNKSLEAYFEYSFTYKDHDFYVWKYD